MVYDYAGFPAHTYQVVYPASGAPALAQRVAELIEAAGLPARKDTQRGFDHGTFVPLAAIYPQADVPVLQLSMQAAYDPLQHLALGRALAPLRDEGVLIIGSGVSYARAFTTKVGVVELHIASQRLQRITLGHGRHQLVMHQPGGAVGCAQVPHESQRRQTGLVLADEVDGQEPGAQRQLGAVEHRASGQRRLMATTLALEQPARAVANNVVLCAIAASAAKPVRPAHRSERRSALVFAAVAGEELRHRHPRFELDSVHRHGCPLGSDRSQRRGRQAHQVSQAEVRDESGGSMPAT